jgi:hypothetical protein
MKKDAQNGYYPDEDCDYVPPTQKENSPRSANTPRSAKKRDRAGVVSPLWSDSSPFSPKKQAKGAPRMGLSARKALDMSRADDYQQASLVVRGDFQKASEIYQPPRKEPTVMVINELDLELDEFVEESAAINNDQGIPQGGFNNSISLGESVADAEAFDSEALFSQSQFSLGGWAAEPKAVASEVLLPQSQFSLPEVELSGVFAQESYLLSYENRDRDCPKFLDSPQNREHRDIFEKLYVQGARFLSKSATNGRYWGQYPSHEKTFFQPMEEPSRQIYFPLSPKDISYTGTWVSAVVKDADETVYPLHIITKGTLGAAENLIGYPARINKIFQGPEFNNSWPEGLGKECIIVCVDTKAQRDRLFQDYESLVLTKAEQAQKTVPNIRVYCREGRSLSEIKKVESCKQRSLLNMMQPNQAPMKPNLTPYVKQWQKLLLIEQHEINIRQGQVRKADFEQACQQFFSPAPLSHELAMTHFSLTGLRLFSGILFQSRKRIIDLKGKLVAQFRGQQMRDEKLQEVLKQIDQSILTRTQAIEKLQNLANEYIAISQRLATMFRLDPMASIDKIEEEIYDAIQSRMNYPGIEESNFQNQFPSGKTLIAWLLTQNIAVQGRFFSS